MRRVNRNKKKKKRILLYSLKKSQNLILESK